jgi:phosphonate metabolism protein PhnN/1,5-bisphosphokinase (PRPP-forming)
MPRTGTLFLVVGPSGAGKDSLIDGARGRLAGDPDFVFARRVITRPVEAGGEAHQAVSDEAFRAMERAGAFALSWHAHRLGYGLPRAIEADLHAGHNVVANVSRTVIEAARHRFPNVRVIHVTAPAEVLAARLAARGRESAADIEERLARSDTDQPEGPDVVTVANDAGLDAGIEAFTRALETGV